MYLTWFEYTKEKNCHTRYILIFCVVGRQVRDGGAYAYRNPVLYQPIEYIMLAYAVKNLC